jgi:hypothetical protein
MKDLMERLREAYNAREKLWDDYEQSAVRIGI